MVYGQDSRSEGQDSAHDACHPHNPPKILSEILASSPPLKTYSLGVAFDMEVLTRSVSSERFQNAESGVEASTLAWDRNTKYEMEALSLAWSMTQSFHSGQTLPGQTLPKTFCF